MSSLLLRATVLSVGLSSLSLLHAQSAPTVAGFGYRLPGNTITAAPGQVMTVSVFGVTGRIPEPVFPIPGSTGLPILVSGISVEFVQGPVTVQLYIRGVQQSACPATGPCSPATTLTIQIPYELIPEGRDAASLRVRENASLVAEVAVNAVTDSVHVINTCDQTGIFLSLAFGVPAGVCAPMVMHARGPLVSNASPAVAGETLVLWAYGLGQVDHPFTSACCSLPSQAPLAIQPFTVGFAYADPVRFPFRRLAPAVPSYAGTSGAGLYQVHFVVPALTGSLYPCSRSLGNLRVSVVGPSSSDSAEICLQ